jgi:hypothetical protein
MTEEQADTLLTSLTQLNLQYDLILIEFSKLTNLLAFAVETSLMVAAFYFFYRAVFKPLFGFK